MYWRHAVGLWHSDSVSNSLGSSDASIEVLNEKARRFFRLSPCALAASGGGSCVRENALELEKDKLAFEGLPREAALLSPEINYRAHDQEGEAARADANC